MKPRITKLRDRMPWMWLHWQCVSGEGVYAVKGYGETPREAFDMWARAAARWAYLA